MVAGAIVGAILALAAAPAMAQGDQTPPALSMTGLGTCILSHNCFVYVESNEDAVLAGTGRALVSGTGRAFPFRRIHRTMKSREEYELTFALRRPARRALARALRRGRRVKAKEKVIVTDAAGNRRVRRRTVPIVLG